jgi:ribulose-phosphate 3-epimerase
MAEIIPAILVKSFREIKEDLDIVEGRVHTVQIDVCDGGYVPSKTWPYASTGKSDIDFDALVAQEVGMPYWEELDFEFDLMVRKVHEKIPDFIAAGASALIVHRGSVTDEELERVLTDYGKGSEALSDFGIQIGLAYPPDVNIVDDVALHIERIDFVQIMGIEKVGYQGQAFSPKALETVSVLRRKFPELTISVDGGVNMENAQGLINAGADKLVVGSAIFGEHDSQDALNSFLAI